MYVKSTGAKLWLGYVLSLTMTVAAGNVWQSVSAKVNANVQGNSTLAPVVEETIAGKVFEVSRMTVNARPERVWAILADFDNAPNVFENLKVCKLLEDRGSSKIVRHVIHPSGYPGTFDYTLEIKEVAPKLMEWHRIRGAFREVDGYWQLEPIEGGRATSVTYQSYINGGFFLPQALIRAQIRDDIPQVMASLKAHAENGMTQIARRPENNLRSRND